MKRIITLCIAMAYCHFVNAQQTSDRTLIFNSTQVTRAAPMLSGNEDFNVLLSKTITQKWAATQYMDFVDTLLDNTYKKIDDSTYEIDVYNPCKDIYLVNCGNIRKDGRGVLLADFSESEHDNFRIYYSDTTQRLNYSGWKYNPFFYKYSQFDGNKDVGRKFLFKYIFPKPILAIATTKIDLIQRKKQFPSENFRSFIGRKEIFKLKADSSFFPKNDDVLFVFEHYGRMARKDINDYLKYRLDNDSDWSFTALSYSPSILLEKLSPGKHTLFVAYNVMKGQDADILEYHFTIAPN